MTRTGALHVELRDATTREVVGVGWAISSRIPALLSRTLRELTARRNRSGVAIVVRDPIRQS